MEKRDDLDVIDIGENPYEEGVSLGDCFGCKHLGPTPVTMEPRKCAAFPYGIPFEIYHGKVDHKVPRPELGQAPDNMVVFEPMSR